ncbi:MAG: type II toxin-antitoxin system prevent-host-death family antitoxin [Myxococcales bacterium]|nr:type II toxin-antitoxin system prevent-host-death family antitoxin [Myxococcales bacterium]
MKKSLSVADAKKSFSECLSRAAAGEPTVITRYGRPVAAIVPIDEIEAARGPRGPRGTLLDLVDLEDTDELAEVLDRIVAERGAPRPVADFD